MHAQSLFWLGSAVTVTAVFYRRMMGTTWVTGIAGLLFAVDDARGATAGFLANRNVLVAATFGVSALVFLRGTFSKRPFVRGSPWTIPVGTCAIVGVIP